MQEIIEEFRNKGISKEDEKRLLEISKYKILAQRRLFREPFAYIQGFVEFFGRIFIVDNRVYVPTKETEQLVRVLLDDLDKNSVVLDVGTGSGVLAVTIKKEHPNVKVFASDINANSLIVAQENARNYNAEIEFYESYYVDDLAIPEPSHIVADLPWGDEHSILDSNSLEELRHMPSQAYFHPLGKTEAYKELIQSILRKHWKPKLYIETGLIKKEEIAKIIPDNLDWKYIQFKNYSVTKIVF